MQYTNKGGEGADPCMTFSAGAWATNSASMPSSSPGPFSSSGLRGSKLRACLLTEGPCTGGPEHRAWKDSVVSTGEGGAGGTEASAGVRALSTCIMTSSDLLQITGQHLHFVSAISAAVVCRAWNTCMRKERSKCFDACIKLAALWGSNNTMVADINRRRRYGQHKQQKFEQGSFAWSCGCFTPASCIIQVSQIGRQAQTHPGVVQQARHFLVAEQGEDLSRRTGGDGEVIEEEPVRAAIGRTGGGGGGQLPIRQVPTGGTAQARD